MLCLHAAECKWRDIYCYTGIIKIEWGYVPFVLILGQIVFLTSDRFWLSGTRPRDLPYSNGSLNSSSAQPRAIDGHLLKEKFRDVLHNVATNAHANNDQQRDSQNNFGEQLFVIGTYKFFAELFSGRTREWGQLLLLLVSTLGHFTYLFAHTQGFLFFWKWPFPGSWARPCWGYLWSTDIKSLACK